MKNLARIDSSRPPLRTPSLRRALTVSITALLVGSLLTGASANAATYTWQTVGTTDIWSNSGADTNWFIDAGATLSPWTDSNDAVFSGTGETITLSGTLAPTTTTIGTGNGTWTLSGAGVLDGAGTLTKNGTGVLMLSTGNTYSSGTTLNGGSITITNANALGSGTLTVGAGAVGPTSEPSSGTNGNFLNLSGLTGSQTFANNIALPSDSTATYRKIAVQGSASTTYGANTYNFSGVISGGGAGTVLYFDSATSGDAYSVVRLSNTNTFIGRVEFNRGSLQIDSDAALGSSSNVLTMDAFTASKLIFNYAGNYTHATQVLTSTNFDTGSNNIAASGLISGGASMTKQGAGTLTLSNNASSNSGATTISAGTLAGTVAHAFGNTTGITISGSGILSLRGDASTSFTKTTGGAAYTVSTSASGATINVDQATVAGTTAKTMTIGTIATTSTAATYQLNFTGANSTGLTVGAITGAASTAAGTVTFNSTNTAGTTTLASYTSANTNGGETLTFAGAGSTTVTGAITPSATTVLKLSKTGTGALTLNGASTFTGGTTISGVLNLDTTGSVVLGNNSALGTGAVTLSNTATSTALFASGARTIANDIVLTSSAVQTNFLASNATAFQLDGLISGGNAGGTFYVNTNLSGGSTGYVKLTNAANSFLGTIRMNRGGLAITSDGALGNAANSIFFDIGTTTQVGLRFDAALSSARSIQLGGGPQIFNTNGNDVTLSGVISGASGQLLKSGAGTLTLSNNANSYGGGTVVNAGAVLVSGSISGSTTVNNGGTLGGSNGTILGAVTVANGGALLGGNGVSTSDSLAISGNLSLASTSQIKLTLAPANTHSSLVRLSGSWSFAANQAFSFIDAGAQTEITYDDIITGLASNPVTGLSDPSTLNWTISNPGWLGTFTYDGVGGVDLVLMQVPEPSSAISLLGGLGVLLGLRRPRRHFKG